MIGQNDPNNTCDERQVNALSLSQHRTDRTPHLPVLT